MKTTKTGQRLIGNERQPSPNNGIYLFYSEACAIKLNDYFIVTGGHPSAKTVSKYNKNGWMMDLPELNTRRRLHACGHYYSETNELVIFDA